MSKSLQNIFLILALIVLTVTNSYAQDTSIQKNTIELCKAVNSTNFYSKTNLITIQNYFKNTYFPNIVVTGLDDQQFRKYVSSYQFAFGLVQTGKLNTQTIIYLKNSQKCYDIEKEIMDYEKNPPQRKISQSEVLYNLIKTFFGFSSEIGQVQDAVRVFVATSSYSVQAQTNNEVIIQNNSTATSAPQSSNSNTSNVEPENTEDLGNNENEVLSCTGYNNKTYDDGEVVDDICDTKKNQTEYNSCIASRRAGDIPMVCNQGIWENL